MHDEYHALIKNKTWTLVPRPPDTNIVRCMWLFRHKYLADGTLSRYKARLVANGSTQLEGVDVDETFSSVVKSGTIQIVLSLAASRHWPIHPLDVKNSFLHGDLSETVYMHQPLGFRDSVDIIRSLLQEFAMTDLGPLNYFLGISITRDSSGLFLSQKKYSIELLDKAHMDNCNPSRTPIDTESKLGSDGDPVSDLTLYRSLAVYLSTAQSVLHQPTKHNEIDIHFVRDLVVVGQVRVLHVPSRYQFADIFTKGLPSALYEEFRSGLSVRCSPSNCGRV
ncbi:ribonuclease H-like domain-containing protein [Tanacetum coccineum]